MKDYIGTEHTTDPKDQYTIICPFCECENTHLLSAKEEREVSNESRLGALLSFECEFGCLFEMNIYQWKGWTHVRSTYTGQQEREDEPREPIPLPSGASWLTP